VTRRLAIAVAIGAACVGLVACGGTKESQQEAKQHLCSSLDNFAASIVDLQALSLGSSSENDVKAGLDKIEKAWDQVVADAKDVKSASTDEIESAWGDLKQALQDRPTDKPVSEVIASVEPKIVAFAQAFKQLGDGLDCKATS
jgi:hypothetical protein